MINDRKLQMYKINKITLCNDYLIERNWLSLAKRFIPSSFVNESTSKLINPSKNRPVHKLYQPVINDTQSSHTHREKNKT